MSEDEKKVDENLMIEYSQGVVNIHGLAEYLKATCSNLRRFWRDYPHFLVGTGSDLKAARFDIADVLTYLKINKGAGYEFVPREEKLEIQVLEPKPEIQKGKALKPIMSRDGRVGKKTSVTGSSSKRREGLPFRLRDI